MRRHVHHAPSLGMDVSIVLEWGDGFAVSRKNCENWQGQEDTLIAVSCLIVLCSWSRSLCRAKHRRSRRDLANFGGITLDSVGLQKWSCTLEKPQTISKRLVMHVKGARIAQFGLWAIFWNLARQIFCQIHYSSCVPQWIISHTSLEKSNSLYYKRVPAWHLSIYLGS